MAEKEKFRWGYAVWIVLLLGIFAFILSGIVSFFSGTDVESLTGNVAMIPVHGVIMASDEDAFFETVSSSTDIAELIEKANKNPSIKAIVLDINSPGGSAVASEEIASAFKKVNKTKVAWIREVGASGAYWIASSSDHIVANRVSITGSIGVIASYLEFGNFLSDHNVTYRRLVAGKYKDIGSPFREMTSEEQQIFQQNLDAIRDYFVSEVAKNRKMKKADVEKAANGLFYIGAQAKDLGLVDELGGKDEVIRYIEQKEKIKAEIVEYKKEEGLIDLLSGTFAKHSFLIGRGIGSSLLDKSTQSAISIST